MTKKAGKNERLSIPLKHRPEYTRLLTRTLPPIIHTEEQNALYLAELEALLEREHSLSRAEKELADLLTVLIEKFEAENYDLPPVGPLAIIEFLMEQHNLRQKDLADVFGSPSIVSEVLNGKRELNKHHIQRLSERFHISPELFF